MKLVGPAFLARFAGRFVNTHPALLPAFPGMHGAARRARPTASRSPAPRCSSWTPASTPARSSPRSRSPVLDDDDEDDAARTHQGRGARDARRRRRPDGPRGLDGHRTGRSPSRERRPAASRSAGRCSASTTRPAWRSSPAGCTRPASRSSRPARPRPGSPPPACPVTPVEELTGFPECLDGRVKTLHPRRARGHPRRPPAAEPPRPARRARHRAVRPGRGQPLPVPRDRRLRRDARRVRRADRHRRPGDGARGGEEPPVSVAVVVDPARYADVLAAVDAGGFTLDAARGGSRPRRSRTPRRTTSRSRPWFAHELAPRPGRLAGVRRRGAGAAGGAALRREPAPAGRALRRPGGRPASPAPSSCTARRCRTTTTSTPTPRCAPPTTSTQPCVAIIKHANPCGIAVGATTIAEAHRKAHACDPVSAFGGVIATNRPVTVAMAEQVAEVFTEVRRRARRSSRGALEVLTRKKNVRLLRVPTATGPAPSSCGQVCGGVLVQTARPARRAGATTRPAGRWPPASRPTTRRWPTWRSPGGPAGR